MKTRDLSGVLGASISWVDSSNIGDSMTLVTVVNGNEEKSVLISSRGLLVVDANDYVTDIEVKKAPVRSKARESASAVMNIGAYTLISLILIFAGASLTGLLNARVVLTGSMMPSINPGDILISTSASHKAPEIGDVVVYTGKKLDGTTVAPFAHRIIAGNAEQGFTVKGDNNSQADIQKPTLSEIEAVVLFTIPFVGKLLAPQNFILILIAGFGIWLIVDAFRDDE
jgi:signal peptidase